MSRNQPHDRASGEIELLIVGGVFVLGLVGYAIIQSFFETVQNNPDKAIETTTHGINGLGEFVGSLSAPALFILILAIAGLGRLLE